jgi:hypothetical protein
MDGTIETSSPGLRRLQFAKYPQKHNRSHCACYDNALSTVEPLSWHVYISYHYSVIQLASMTEWNIYYSYIGRNRGSSIEVEDGMGQIPRGRLANLRFRRETSDIHASESQVF